MDYEQHVLQGAPAARSTVTRWQMQMAKGSLAVVVQEKRADCVSESDRPKTISRRIETTSKATFWFRAPAWLINRVLAVEASRLPFGWGIQFRTYNVIPLDSPIFTYALKGNIQELREVSKQRKASPYDSDPYGVTPLRLSHTFQP